MNTAQQMMQCYKLFREEYPENWQEILFTFDDADALNNKDKMIAQCQSLFHRLVKQQTQSVSTSASPDNRQSLDGVQLASMSKAHVTLDSGRGKRRLKDIEEARGP